MLEISDLRKKRDCTIFVARTKALVSRGGNAQLFCGFFIFAYVKTGFHVTRLISVISGRSAMIFKLANCRQ